MASSKSLQAGNCQHKNLAQGEQRAPQAIIAIRISRDT